MSEATVRERHRPFLIDMQTEEDCERAKLVLKVLGYTEVPPYIVPGYLLRIGQLDGEPNPIGWRYRDKPGTGDKKLPIVSISDILEK